MTSIRVYDKKNTVDILNNVVTNIVMGNKASIFIYSTTLLMIHN